MHEKPVYDADALKTASTFMTSVERNRAEFWEQRYGDMRDLLFEIIAHQAEVCCELRSDIERLEAEIDKLKAEQA